MRFIPWPSGYNFADSDAAVIAAAIETADAASLEAGVKSAIDALVIGLKADASPNGGVTQWAAIRFLRLPGARSLTGHLLNFKNPAQSYTNTNFVSGDYHRENGLLGAATKSLSLTLSDVEQNNASLGAFVHTAATTDPLTFVDIGTSTRCRRAGTAVQNRSRATSGTNISGGYVAGLIGSSRHVSTEFITRCNGSNTTTTVTSTEAAGTAYSEFGGGTPRHYGAWEGKAVNLTNLESRVNTYLAAIAAAIA